MNRKNIISGSALAIAIAGAMGGAQARADEPSSAAQSVDLVHCYGTNACQGQNDCKSTANACKGQAECKTEGFIKMPAKSCDDVGGTVRGESTDSVGTADLVHCYDVNVCKGHNDCKTANNACAGQASCQGQGFVAVPEKACKLLGGEEGA